MKGLNQNIVTVEIDRNNIEIMVEIKINSLKQVEIHCQKLKYVENFGLK